MHRFFKPLRHASFGLAVLVGNLAAAADLSRYHGVFQELPLTAITPEGWLAGILERQRDGLGRHHDVSGHPFDTCLWAGTIPQAAWESYEQTAYLIDGLYRSGLLLKDEGLMSLGRANIEYVLNHPQPDGSLGPTKLGPITAKLIGLPETDGKLPDTQWPMAVFTRALMAYYESTGDKAVLGALTRHYLSMPENFGLAPRDVNNIEGMCWLYGKTGDERMAALAERTWRNAAGSPNDKTKNQWDLENLKAAKMMRGHGVSVNEQAKQPALLFLATGNRDYLDAALGAFRSLERDHELVDGVVSSDEGLHGKTAESAHETCVISDYTWSLGYLLEASGDAAWADKIERAVFNGGLGAVGKDFKSHQYFSSPNQVVATQESLNLKVNYPPQHLNRQAYRPEFVTQCCTGNVHRILPNYAARTWMSDGKGGLAAVLYAPSAVRATVGAEQVPVTITEKTDYPFDGRIELKVACGRAVKFPLFVRIPGWAQGAAVSINGKPVEERPVAGTFLKIERSFADGDVVRLDFPMEVRLEKPVPNGISLVRGPLVYSLKIKEDRKPVFNTRKNDPDFPAWDLTPASPWNYALLINDSRDLDKVSVKTRALEDFPWMPNSVSVTLGVPAKRIPAWTLTPEGKNSPLPLPPFETSAAVESVELIPTGATQLRLTVFPHD